MEEVLPDMLFAPGELEPMPETCLLLFLPQDDSFPAEEMQMLERMLTALQYKPGSWRYLYHGGQPDWNMVSEENPEIFFFAAANSSEQRPGRRESGGFNWFFLPSLSAIFSDQLLKREVWELIKR